MQTVQTRVPLSYGSPKPPSTMAVMAPLRHMQPCSCRLRRLRLTQLRRRTFQSALGQVGLVGPNRQRPRGIGSKLVGEQTTRFSSSWLDELTLLHTTPQATRDLDIGCVHEGCQPYASNSTHYSDVVEQIAPLFSSPKLRVAALEVACAHKSAESGTVLASRRNPTADSGSPQQ